jgi:hypothetical protein
MTLLISAKDRIKDDFTDPDISKDLFAGFRQVELWANALQFHPFALAANWTRFDSRTSNPGWYMDPFGLVHVQASLRYTGATTAGTLITLVATVPPPIAAVTRHGIAGTMTPAASATPAVARLDIDVITTVITVLPSISTANPSFVFEGTYNPNL